MKIRIILITILIIVGGIFSYFVFVTSRPGQVTCTKDNEIMKAVVVDLQSYYVKRNSFPSQEAINNLESSSSTDSEYLQKLMDNNSIAFFSSGGELDFYVYFQNPRCKLRVQPENFDVFEY